MEIFSNLKYCIKCCIPETQEGVTFDDFGVCAACLSSEDKMHIGWVSRELELRKILENVKSNAGDGYDCILPISGGKDSFYQAHVLVNVYKMKPLAVTFSHNWYSETGFYNLQRCLQVFGLDHLQFTPSRSLVNKVARKSLFEIGDSCWHCHAGIGAFPLNVATKFKIPLLIWGESVSESSGRGTHGNPITKFDRDYFTKVSAKLTAEEMADENLTLKDLEPFKLPSYSEIEDTGVWGIHLGDYLFWDEERQTEWIIKEFGWKETEVEGSYKGYKSAECIMPGMHDLTCYLKRGFGRSTWQASVDVRNGLLTRDEAFELISQYDQELPEALDYYLGITGFSKEEFLEIMEQKKLSQLKSTVLPLHDKRRKNAEVIKPFVEQLIDKHLHSGDLRVNRDKYESK